MIEIGLIILLTISIILFIKYNNLTSKYKDMLKRKNSAENTSALYFNTLITYRDVIVRNNLTVPQNTEIPTEKKDNKKTFTVDSILDEIAEKGMDNISEDKLNFLKKKKDGKN